MFDPDILQQVQERASTWETFFTEKKLEAVSLRDQNYTKQLLEGIKAAGHYWDEDVEQGIEDWNNSTVFPIISSVDEIFKFIMASNRWDLFPLFQAFDQEYSWVDLSSYNEEPDTTWIPELAKKFEGKNRFYLLYQLASHDLRGDHDGDHDGEIEEQFYRELSDYLIGKDISHTWKTKFNMDSFASDFTKLVSGILSFQIGSKEKFLPDIHASDIFEWTIMLRKDAVQVLFSLGFRAKEIRWLSKKDEPIGYNFPKNIKRAQEIYFIFFYPSNYQEEYREESLELSSVEPKYELSDFYYKFWKEMKQLE